MKKSIHKLTCLILITSGLSFYACQKDACMTQEHTSTSEKTEARTDDSELRLSITTEKAGQVDSLITANLEYDRRLLSHLTVSGPINNTDISTLCKLEGLDSLVMTDAVINTIPNSSFSNFKSPAHIILPKTVKKIGAYAFYGYYGDQKIKSVYMHDSISEIDVRVFQGNSSLESVRLSQKLEAIPREAFYNCNKLKEITIPESVVDIKEWAFYGCSSLSKVKLTDKIASIEQYAFSYCSSLEEINWPKYLKTIPTSCFSGCSKLKFEIPNHITSIGSYAFNECTSITEYKIPESVESIGNNAFQSTGIKSLTINSGTLTADGLFAGCPIETLTISEGVTTLPNWIFSGCYQLKSIKFPSTMQNIPERAFSGCTALKNIELNEGLTSIGAYSFTNTPISSIKLPSSLKSIGSYAFSECKTLKEVEWNEGLATINDYAFEYVPLTEFKAPTTLTSIGHRAFANAGTLKNITLNEGLKTIGYGAFHKSLIETITIPSTVTTVSVYDGWYDNIKYLFDECDLLTSIHWKSTSTAPQLHSYQENRNILLYLPEGGKSDIETHVIVGGKSTKTMQLQSGGNFNCPEAFEASKVEYSRVFNRKYDSNDDYYSFENKVGESSCWQTIVLPFDVTTIKCGDKELVPFGAEKEGAYPFWLRELTDKGFVRATEIKANKPYIIAMPNSYLYEDEYNIRGTVTFSAANVTIPETGTLKKSEGASYNFYPNYSIQDKDENYYVLNRIEQYYKNSQYYWYGSIFVPSEYACNTFHAYISDVADSRSIITVGSSLASRKAGKIGPIPQEDDM